MIVKMKKEKETKNTVRFAEILKSENDSPKIGVLYVPKTSLNELGWNGEKEITVEITEEDK